MSERTYTKLERLLLRVVIAVVILYGVGVAAQDVIKIKKAYEYVRDYHRSPKSSSSPWR